MICPTCGYDNVPGSEECSHCQLDLTQLDRPAPVNRIERSLMEEQVRLLEPKAPVTLRVSATVGDCLRLLLERNLGALLIVDEQGMLRGIFSERDLLTKVAGLHADVARLPVQQFMTSNPESVRPDDTLAFALHKMDVGGYRHLPVVDGGKPVGMVSVRDMLRHFTRLCHG